MKKIGLVIAILLMYATNSFAQMGKKDIEYDLQFNAGFLRTLASSGKLDNTENQYINVSYYRTISKSLNLAFTAKNVKFNNVLFGLELGIDEFTYGYTAGSTEKVPGVSGGGGNVAPDDRVILYKLAPVIGYELPISPRLQLRTTLQPTLAYFPYSSILNDTNNAFWWGGRDADRDGAVWFLTQPSKQSNGFHFLAKANAALSYKFSKHIAGTFSLAYQQGFRNFVEDQKHIFMPTYPQHDNKMYYTKVNGTAWQFHFGLRYYIHPNPIIKSTRPAERRQERIARRANARISKYKYDVELNLGYLRPYVQTQGNSADNPYFWVRNQNSLAQSHSVALHTKNYWQPNVIMGVELGMDRFSYGYASGGYNGGPLVGNSVGKLAPDAKVSLYKLSAVLGYEFELTNWLQLRTTVHPTLAVAPYSPSLNDTNNASWRSNAYVERALWMQTNPPKQNPGPHFLAKMKAAASFKVAPKFAVILSAAYQQGFINFIEDNTEVFTPENTNIPRQTLYTKVNGTATQLNLGVRYQLNR